MNADGACLSGSEHQKAAATEAKREIEPLPSQTGNRVLRRFSKAPALENPNL